MFNNANDAKTNKVASYSACSFPANDPIEDRYVISLSKKERIANANFDTLNNRRDLFHFCFMLHYRSCVASRDGEGNFLSSS